MACMYTREHRLQYSRGHASQAVVRETGMQRVRNMYKASVVRAPVCTSRVYAQAGLPGQPRIKPVDSK